LNADTTIYEAAGGADAFELLVNRFYGRALEEPLLRPLFLSMPREHVHNVALWLAEVFGGPPAYSEERGGHPTVIGAHAGFAITEQQRARWVELMLETARDTLPAIPELHEQLAAYLNWGSKIAVAASQPGFVDDRGREPVPHWGWHGRLHEA
jgi:hemoglobin